jgi:U3 small nucleolar RNA-associated protein 19
MAKELKKAPVVEFHIPKRVFLPHDEPGLDGPLIKLWNFS